MKIFNTMGLCIPEENYMVNISGKINRIIEELINPKCYFTINRPRQYGKTTILHMLEKALEDKYIVLSLSFENLGEVTFQSEENFVKTFVSIIIDNLNDPKLSKKLKGDGNTVDSFPKLAKFITQIVKKSTKDLVLMIDEVDKSANYVIFINFLGMLRNKYLLRKQGKDQTFHNVILAGVHDIKTLKAKIKSDTTDTTTRTEDNFNSPWNIAADFLVEMSFNPQEIATMLEDFSKDRGVAMDIPQMAEKIYFYTSGYPFLVSRICEIIDVRLKRTEKWELADIDEAVKVILKEGNTNFDSLIKNLENNIELYNFIEKILVDGDFISYVHTDPIMAMGTMYGFMKEDNGICKIHNKIYELLIYDHMMARVGRSKTDNSGLSCNIEDNFIVNHGLNMEKILLRFQQFMKEQYSSRDEEFLERHGKLLLLAFIKPIINGKGFDFKEVQISEERRLDVVITYLGNKYVMELKIWRGPESHQRGLQQLAAYLANQGLTKGYLVVFNFNKKPIAWVEDKQVVNDKEIFMVSV